MYGHRDVGAQPVDRDDQQGEEDLPPQVGDPEHVLEAGEHSEPSSRRSTRGLDATGW